jgi:muramidase (phage lysozyme)
MGANPVWANDVLGDTDYIVTDGNNLASSTKVVTIYKVEDGIDQAVAVSMNEYQLLQTLNENQLYEWGKTVRDNKISDGHAQLLDIKPAEIYVRAMLHTVKVAENHGKEPLDYNHQFGGGKFGTEKDNPYEKHPEEEISAWGKTSDVAGAYQFKARTWKWVKEKLGLKDFTPKNQDKAAVWLFKYRKAYEHIVVGDFKMAFSALKKEWTSLPGAAQEGVAAEKAKTTFYEGVGNEVFKKSNIATPRNEQLSD